MKIGLPVVLLFALLISACGPSRSEFEGLKRNAETLQQENLTLKDEIQFLKKENERIKADLENLHIEPQRLLTQAQNELKNRKFAEVKKTVETLLQMYPCSCEAFEAKNLVEQADQAIIAELAAVEVKNRQLKAEDQKRIAALTSKMRITTDAATNTTWYEDKNTPQNNNAFKAYLAISTEKSKSPRLHFTTHSVSKGWLNIESLTVIADGKKFDIRVTGFERGGIGTGYVWEYVDLFVDSNEIEWIRAIITSKRALIQYHGEQADVEREITQAQKKSLQNVLDTFAVLGGTLPQ